MSTESPRAPLPTDRTRDGKAYLSSADDVDAALMEKRNQSTVRVLARSAPVVSHSGHGCAGVVQTDAYYDPSDEEIHIGVSVWYDCENYLEILGDVILV
jgi:hypothetical protein